MANLPMYPLCHNNIESHLHAFRNCSVVKELRKLIKLQLYYWFFDVLDWREWLMINLMDTSLCSDIQSLYDG